MVIVYYFAFGYKILRYLEDKKQPQTFQRSIDLSHQNGGVGQKESYSYKFNRMEVKIDEDNYFHCNLECGGRITELVLAGHRVISADYPVEDLGSGMFLMFPWISKVPNHPYDPTLTNQYHGFVMNTKRTVIGEASKEGEKTLSLRQAEQRQNQHNFIETYVLRKGSLEINFEVLVNQKDKTPFCFGYHPYLQIDDQKKTDLEIRSDISTLLQFDENTLPIYPFVQQKVELKARQKYNNLFKGGSFFELVSKKRTHLRIQSDLPYWQIYTPDQSHKIAVQPASFCGNLYNIYQKDSTLQLPYKGTIVLKAWDE